MSDEYKYNSGVDELPVRPGDPSVTPQPDTFPLTPEELDAYNAQQDTSDPTPEHWKQIKVRFGEVKTMIDGRIVATHPALEFTADFDAAMGIITLKLKGEAGVHFAVTMHVDDHSDENMALIGALMMRMHNQYGQMFKSSIEALESGDDMTFPLFMLDKEAMRAYAINNNANHNSLRDAIAKSFGISPTAFGR